VVARQIIHRYKYEGDFELIFHVDIQGLHTVKANHGIDITADSLDHWQGKLTLPSSESPLVAGSIFVLLWLNFVVLWLDFVGLWLDFVVL